MSFLEALSAITEGGASVGRNLLGSVVRQGLGEGLSGAAMLSAFREAGGAIRTQSFYQLVGEVSAASAIANRVPEIALDALPPAEAIATWSGGRPGSYLYRVRVYYRESEGGVLGVQSTTLNVQTSELVTPADAVAMAQNTWAQGSGGTTGVGQELLGMEVGTIFHQEGAA